MDWDQHGELFFINTVIGHLWHMVPGAHYKRMYGGQWSPELAEAMGLNRQVLEQMVDQRLLLQEAQRLHLEATPEEVRKKILDIQILNPDGKWAGDELYNRYIQSIGFNSASEFEDELANEITINKIESALANTVVVSAIFARSSSVIGSTWVPMSN